MKSLLFFYFAIAAFCTDSKADDAKYMSNIQKLKDKLFKDYDKDVRPEAHHSNTTHVYFDIIPFYLIDLDEDKSLFYLDSWFILNWVDRRLQWNTSDFDGVDALPVPDHFAWQPDLRIYNGHSGTIDPTNNVPILIHPGGMIYWVPPATVATVCDVTTPVGKYPYDTHTCNITVGSWTHNGWQMDIEVNPHGMYWDFFPNINPSWEIDTNKCSITKVTTKYECCEEPYVTVDATFVIKRRYPLHLQVVWAPCILVMMLALAMFWIPSDSGKKITLGSSLLIILTALTIYCAALTKSLRALLLAVSFIQSTIIAVASAVFLEVVVITLGRISGPRKPPELLVNLLSGTVGAFMCVWAPWRHSLPGDKIRLQEDSEPVHHDPTPQQEWLLVATGLDRVLFLVYVIVFSAIHQI